MHKNLDIILKKANEKPNCYFKGIPELEEMGNDVKYEYNTYISKSIDFIFVKYILDEDLYEIRIFDVTTNQDSIKSKVDSVKKLLKKLLEFERKPQEIRFNIVYHIVCPMQSCKNYEEVHEDYLVEFVGIESLTFADCGKGIKELFETVRHLVIYSKK